MQRHLRNDDGYFQNGVEDWRRSMWVGGSSPFSADDDLLTAWKFELGSSQSFLRMCSGSIFASDRQQNLAYCNPSTNTLWLAKRCPHAGLQAISSSTRQHFVDPQHMERVHSDTQVERILASILGHVLVASNPSCFQSFTRNVLFLPADQMYAEGELVHPLLLHTHIVDANLRVWHSSTEPRLWVWLVLDLPITSRRPCEKFTVRQQEERILLNTKISLKETQQHRQEYVLLVKRKSTENYKKIKRENQR